MPLGSQTAHSCIYITSTPTNMIFATIYDFTKLTSVSAQSFFAIRKSKNF